jgi:hypothetical protein
MHDHLLVIFGLMAERRVHLELGSRSTRAIALWQGVFDQYFHLINGSGRVSIMGFVEGTQPPSVSKLSSQRVTLAIGKLFQQVSVAGTPIMLPCLLRRIKRLLGALQTSIRFCQVQTNIARLVLRLR